ncbi:MAG: hypothetical protein AB1467_06885 [Candidatus Diapherotrites archaeon]
MTEKKTTMNVYPTDKKLFKDLTFGLIHLDDSEADAFHKLLEDYNKLKKERKPIQFKKV